MKISADTMKRRRAMDRVLRMFGDTFRSLSLLRDSLMFRVVEDGSTDTSPLQSELKKLGWGKAEKMLVLFTDRLEVLSRMKEEEADFDDELYQV